MHDLRDFDNLVNDLRLKNVYNLVDELNLQDVNRFFERDAFSSETGHGPCTLDASDKCRETNNEERNNTNSGPHGHDAGTG